MQNGGQSWGVRVPLLGASLSAPHPPSRAILPVIRSGQCLPYPDSLPSIPPPEVGVGNRADPPGIKTQTVGLQPSGKSPPGCEGGGKGGRAGTSKRVVWVTSRVGHRREKRKLTVGRCPRVSGEGRGPLGLYNPRPSQNVLPPHSLLSLSFTIKGNGTAPGWGGGLGCCSGAVRGNGSQLLCGRGGPGLRGRLCFSEPKKTTGAAMGLEQLGKGTYFCLCAPPARAVFLVLGPPAVCPPCSSPVTPKLCL